MAEDLLIGKQLPTFKLQMQNQIFLSDDDLKGKNTILFLYPKNDTSGCTRENIEFSENLNEFNKLKITPFGMSKDSAESHMKFMNKHDLKLNLIADPDLQLIKYLGSWVKKSMYGKEYMGIERSTFLINKENTIVKVWRKVKVNGHVQEVLKICKNTLLS